MVLDFKERLGIRIISYLDYINQLTVVKHQILYITHNLCIAMVGVGRDCLQHIAVFLVDGGGLGMQDKGDGQQTLEGLESANMT